jgi:hypothetical protein
MEKTYWGNNGPHQNLSSQLEKLIPSEGAVEAPRGRNKKLEKFRQASNAYYDIFNNGGGNRGPLIRRTFGISVGAFRYGSRSRHGVIHTNWNGIHRIVEPIMDKIILEAAAEQGLIPAEAQRGLEISGRLEAEAA